tara:strand:+ start:418 stop:585 length:168 start_codon:yes stop_codon:yes gene_type:complete
MSSTFEEVREKILANYDVDLLCEVLDISSETLVDRFEDLVMKNIHKFEEEDFQND